MSADDRELPPDQAPAADLPVHARERLGEMRKRHFYSSDLSVSEFLLVKQAGFDPLGLVMGSSIYRIRPNLPQVPTFSPGQMLTDADLLAGSGEMTEMTTALYHARELAMTRMDEEAEALGADGVLGVKMELNLHAWGQHIAEFVCIGTAVKHRGGGNFRNMKGKPFNSALSGQDFWTLLASGYRPVGFVMGNCVYFVSPASLAVWSGDSRNVELVPYTHSLYDARELAIERLQAEAEDLQATGIVGVEIDAKMHSWKSKVTPTLNSVPAGEMLEFFVAGTAVVPIEGAGAPPTPTMVIAVNK